jgi:competence protein ComEC
MIRWIPYAFTRIVFFFMLGIVFGIYFPDVLSMAWANVVFLILVCTYGALVYLFWKQQSQKIRNSLKTYTGIVGLAAIFLAGFINVLSNTESRNADHLIQVSSDINFYKAVVVSSPQLKGNSWRMEADIDFVKSNGEWRNCEGKIMLYVSNEAKSDPLEYGDVILVKGQPTLVLAPSNPEEFDYRRFLNFKNIYHQHFTRPGEITKMSNAPPSVVNYYALKCRRWADATLRDNITGEREKGLASALVLGVTDGLDNELLSAYKATGAMHVLAVSGLHVGIIYGLLLFLLKPLQKGKVGPWLVAGISLVLLWIYAFITGLSPSVLRAVTMFSFLALAKPAGHRTNIYNTLAASGFCILMYDPFFLMSVGFQLSYLAVLGIVYIQPGLYNLLEPTNRLWDEIWKITCVSIAAQLATFALGLFYFHQFPNYFLLSNLVVIPGSFIILILGLVMLAVNFISPVALALGFILEWIIKILNYVVFALEDLPYSLFENIYITSFQCFLLILIVVSILMLIRIKRFNWVLITSSLCLLFVVAQWIHYDRDVNIEKFTVYNVRGHSAIDLTNRGVTYFMADSALRQDANKIGYHITPHRVKLGTANKIYEPSNVQERRKGCSLTIWKGKSFLQVYERAFAVPQGLSVDFVIVSKNAIRDLNQLSKVTTSYVIIDSSNSFNNVSKLITQSRNFQFKTYSVVHQGAFELNI